MNCVSLFSGCGGLDLGIARAGFRIVLGSDNDSACAVSHKANFPDAVFFEGSVTDLTDGVLAKSIPAALRDGIDLLIGGPPCPPFSKSRFYRKDKPRALGDQLASETLSGYLNVLAALQPRAFLLENVPGMAYDVHRDALDLVLSRAASLGYHCDRRIVNAADYGVPQIRHRFILVGTRGGARFEFPSPTHRDPLNESLFTHDLPPWRTAGEALADLDTEAYADDRGHVAGGKHHALLKEIPPGDNYLYFTAKRGHPRPQFEWRSRYWSFLLKLSPGRPAWTIQARRSNNMGPFHWRNRILRLTEVKRLQTFPDDWQLSGTIEHAWRQLGNAVPPLLAQRLGDALMACLATSGGKGATEDARVATGKRVLARAG